MLEQGEREKRTALSVSVCSEIEKEIGLGEKTRGFHYQQNLST